MARLQSMILFIIYIIVVLLRFFILLLYFIYFLNHQQINITFIFYEWLFACFKICYLLLVFVFVFFGGFVFDRVRMLW